MQMITHAVTWTQDLGGWEFSDAVFCMASSLRFRALSRQGVGFRRLVKTWPKDNESGSFLVGAMGHFKSLTCFNNRTEK